MVPLMTEREAALQMLIERLRWPVKIVRWKTAKAIRTLLVNDETRQSTTKTLLGWFASRHLESEVISGLSMLAVTPYDARPIFSEVEKSVSSPSIAADFLLKQMYGRHSERWCSAHSGTAPASFSAESYFHEHKTAHVPPVLKRDLEYLERKSGLPFLRQWGFEWTALRERLQAGYTSYPNYFGDFALQREGIYGQFILHQSELYRSAYQRTLACAVSEWNMPPDAAEQFSVFDLPVLPGLFEVEPAPRPAWLPLLDATMLNGDDLASIARNVISREPEDAFQTVLLRIPTERSFDEFGELELAAYLVDDAFELDENQLLHSRSQRLWLTRYQFDMVRPSLEPQEQAGKLGSALPVCSDEVPFVRGYWHDDYYQRGVSLPATYCFQQPTLQQAQADGIHIRIDQEEVGSLAIWHDAWTPVSAPNSATRCGTITRIRRSELAAAAARLGRKVGWFVRLSRMEKPEGGYERVPKDASAFFRL